jgi:hypothetical protein
MRPSSWARDPAVAMHLAQVLFPDADLYKDPGLHPAQTAVALLDRDGPRAGGALKRPSITSWP